MDETLLRRTIPVVVNFFNQPTYLLRTVASLVGQDFRNIWVIDQASTTREARQALALLETSARCRVYSLRENLGPHWFFRSDLFDLVGSFFVYTDADLELRPQLPADFLSRLLGLTGKYRVGKAGCALDISDAHLFINRVTTVGGQNFSIKEWEERFWTREIEPEVYAAIVDTTFALYNKQFFNRDDALRAVRVAGAWTAKHLPWYEDKKVPVEEWRVYEQSTKHSHWFNMSRPVMAARPSGEPDVDEAHDV